MSIKIIKQLLKQFSLTSIGLSLLIALPVTAQQAVQQVVPQPSVPMATPAPKPVVSQTVTPAHHHIPIQHWATKNSVPVLYVYLPQLPIVDISVAFDAGSRRDGDKPGLANMVSDMMNEGTTTLNADQIATQLDQLAANLSTNANHDMAVLSLRSLKDPALLNPAVDLFTQIISQSNFPLAPMQREQQNVLSNIQAIGQAPDALGAQTFLKTLYGNYPYSHPVIGDEQTVSKMTVQDLVDFYHRYYVARNALIVIVGDISQADAAKTAEQIVGKLPLGEKAPAIAAPVPPKPQAVNVSYPSSQAYIFMGSLGITRNDPNRFPLLIGNHILGGGMTSRLFATVREANGLSYAIDSYFIPLANRGPFIVSLQTRTAMTQKAINITKQVLQDYYKSGPTEKEIDSVKKFLIGNFPLQLSSNVDILNSLVMIGFYQLPLDYLDTYTSKIQAATPEQIHKAIQTYINPNNMISVVIGEKPNDSGVQKNVKPQ